MPAAWWKVIAILALVAFGLREIRDAWQMLDLRAVHIIGEPGNISIDGGVGELALGALALFAAFTLSRHWWGAGMIERPQQPQS